MPPPHSGVNMGMKILSLLKDWGIHKKVFTLTLDNASSNDSMATYLKGELSLISNGDYFHMRCCAQILNLIVQDGIKMIEHAVYKVRESVKYCKGSQSRKQSFLTCVAKVDLDCKRGLRQDVPTRWNSTYIMLESVLYYKKALIYFQMMDANYVHCPSSEEWEQLEKLFKFLKIFYEATCDFSGTKYPTANLYFPTVLKVISVLVEEKVRAESFMRDMAIKMYAKFEKYWGDFSTIMAIVAILYPRFKFGIVEWGYGQVYKDDLKSQLDTLNDKLFELFNSYKNLSSSQPSFTNPGSSSVGGSSSDEFIMAFCNFSSTRYSISAKSDLEAYLEEPLIPFVKEFNILDYWKTNQLRYPILSKMAMDILAIPVSTVASESAFSDGGRVLDAYRSSLKPTTVEALICLRDWSYGAKMDPMLDELCGDVMKIRVEDQMEDSMVESSSQMSTSSVDI